MKKFSLEITLNDIKRRGLEMNCKILEITTSDSIIRLPLEKVGAIALVSKK